MKSNSGDNERNDKGTTKTADRTTNRPTSESKPTKGRGFASMDEERQREIASMGGKAAHQRGTAHEFTPEEAREAGAKGGKIAHERGTAHEFTPEEAREAGRKGGQTSARSRQESATADDTSDTKRNR